MNTNNTTNQDFLDILFDGRNKAYGAYALRRTEDVRIRTAIIGTASIALLIIAGYAISNQLKAADMPIRNYHPKMDSIHLVDLDKNDPPPPPAPLIPTPPPPANSSIAFATLKIVNTDVNTDEEPPKLDSIGTKTVGLTTAMGDVDGFDIGVPDGYGDKNAIVEAPKSDGHGDGQTFMTVELNPSFPGGEAALMKFLQKNIHYPHLAQENGIQGRVYVEFVVDWQGNIQGVKTNSHLGAGLEEEAMRVVKLMPQWKPGKQNGQTVNVQFNLPIGFQLANEN